MTALAHEQPSDMISSTQPLLDLTHLSVTLKLDLTGLTDSEQEKSGYTNLIQHKM